MCLFEREFKVSMTLVIVLMTSLIVLGGTSSDGGNLSINLKSQSVVLGPKITLGNVSQVMISDTELKRRIAILELGDAPPPGESSEITLNYIKRCLRANGFEEYVDFIRGPKIIRITTAHIEIDKAFLQEELVYDGIWQKKTAFPGFLACFFC